MWEWNDVGGAVNRVDLSWYHWDKAKEYVGAKNEILEKKRTR